MIESSLIQDELPIKAGVSRSSIQNKERGDDVKFGTILKILMALQLDLNLDILVLDPTKRASYYMNMKSESDNLIEEEKRMLKNKIVKMPNVN